MIYLCCVILAHNFCHVLTRALFQIFEVEYICLTKDGPCKQLHNVRILCSSAVLLYCDLPKACVKEEKKEGLSAQHAGMTDSTHRN